MHIPATLLSSVLALISAAAAQTSPCVAPRSIGICAQYVVPYSDNAYFWNQYCEIGPPADPNTLMASDVEFYDPLYGCDTAVGFVLTCCARDASCAVYEDCTGPATPPPVPAYPPALAPGWSVAVPCAVDNPQRVLAGVAVMYLPGNTPLLCTSQCGAQDYAYAGVEYGDECYCGTGYVDGVVPPAANLSDCGMLCSGSMYDVCGGSWRMQVYKFN